MAGSRRTGLLLLAILCGCGVATSSADGSAGGIPSGLASSTVLPSGSATTASASGTQIELPPVPDGFPLIYGMQPVTSDDPSVIAAWRTDADGAEVYAFYEDELPAAGFQVDLAGPGGGVAIFRFGPPEGERLQMDMYAEGHGTLVELRLPHP
jgi:hypothetical protein